MSTARRKIGQVFVGTSGWNYPHWRAPFYRGARAADFLRFYAARFGSVEVNKSFYRLLSAAETRRWAEQTPASFLFAVKGSRFLTHMLKLKNPRRGLQRFFRPLAPLDGKLGPVLFQLPPRWGKNAPRLEEFLDALPAGQRTAIELRNPAWIDDEVLDVLRRHNAAFCVYEFDGFRSPRAVTADFTYVRLHGPTGRYQGRYSIDEMRAWSKWVNAQRDAGVDVYFYFDNDQKAFAVENASELAALLSLSPAPAAPAQILLAR